MKHIRFLVLLALSFLLVFTLSAQAEETVDLTLDQHYTISADGNISVKYIFTPSETGIYTFYAYPRTGEVTYLEVGFNYPDGNGVGSSSESGAVYMDVVLHQDEPALFTVTIESDSSCTAEVWLQHIEHAAAVSERSSLSTNYGSTETLAVYAFCPGETFTYEWIEVDPNTDESVLIEGANQSSYTIESVTANKNYICNSMSSNGTFQASNCFYIIIDSNLTLEYVGEDSITVSPETPFTLAVQAHADYGEISYQWYCYGESTGYDWIELEENGPSLTVDGQSCRYMQYKCTAVDYNRYRSSTVYYYVSTENHLSASADETYYTVSPGDSVTLSVTARCDKGGLHYVWTKEDYSQSLYGEYTKLEGETGSELILNNIQAIGTYCVYVTDDYGDEDTVYFTIRIPNGLYAERVGSYGKYVTGNENVTLSVRAGCSTGSVSYQWYHESEPVPGANQSTYRVSGSANAGYYTCVVTDQYQNRERISCFVSVVSELTVFPEGDGWIMLAPEETAVLRAAVCNPDNAELTYQWSTRKWEWGDYTDTPIEGADGPALTVVGRGGYTNYVCSVTDNAGHSDYVEFSVEIHSGLLATITADGAGPDHRSYSLGQTATLHAEALSEYGPITYQWYQDDGDGYLLIEGATTADYTKVLSLETDPHVTEYTIYRCRVSDGYETSEINIDLDITDPDITVAPVGDTLIQCQEGDEITLAVSVSGISEEDEVRYTWYMNYEEPAVASGESYTFHASAGISRYQCYVFVNSMSYEAVFLVNTAPVPAMNLNQEVTVTFVNDEPALVSFTPDNTGMYTFSITSGALSNGTYFLTLFDNGWDELYSSGTAFSYRLTGGEKYYLTVSTYYYDSRSGSLCITEANGSRSGAFTLIAGQSFVFPSIKSYENYVSASVSDAPGVVRVADDLITAVSPGTAHVTVTYDNGYQVHYTVTVVSGVPVLRIPRSVSTVEAEAFQGDTGIRFVRLSSRIVSSKAFQGTDLQQIVFDSTYYDPFVASDAISGSPLIVGTMGLQEYAAKHGCEFLLIRHEEGGNG